MTWSPFDWRAFDGISFWLHGRDRGVEIFVDIIDNRNPQSTSDDAERFVYTFRDDFIGWRRVAIVFDGFVRKETGNAAPNDGLGLSSVHGWGIGTTHTDGPATYLIDDFALLRLGGSSIETSRPGPAAEYAINELPMYGMREKTPAQRRADEKYIRQMTKGGRSREEAAQIAAKNAWNVFYSGDKRFAIKRFNQAWLLDPGNQLALWGFAVTCVDRGQIEDAARYYRLAIDKGPPNPSLERDYRLALRQLEMMKLAAQPGPEP
ncbi:MAG: hypothetical protein KJP17_08335 [Gammaproteobacteria bacterium]|nr:hypothetical protein [Gammaproteobacteria bacterium]